MWRQLITISSTYFYSVLYSFLLLIFLLHFIIAGQAVYGDGIGYFAHLHTWKFDNDWNYDNEYQHIYTPENNNTAQPRSADAIQIVGLTESGHAANHFFPGAALMWLPFYWLADVTLWLVGSVTGLARNGYSDTYQIFVGAGAVFYVVAGLYFLEKVLQLYCKDALIVRLSLLVLLFSSPLLYYGSYDVINSHSVSFFLSCLFFYLLLVTATKSMVTMSVVTALALMTRVQDAVFLPLYVLHTWWTLNTKKISSHLIHTIVLFIAVYLLTLLPLFIYWSETFGSFTEHTYIQAFIKEKNAGDITSWWGSLFDLRNGLFIKSPLLFILLGWYVMVCVQQKKFLYWQLAIFFIIQFVIISIQGGWRAAAYGGRMYISSLPFFAVLLVVLLKDAKKFLNKSIIILMVTGVLVNVSSMAHFVLYAKEAEQGKKGIEMRTIQRVRQLWKLW